MEVNKTRINNSILHNVVIIIIVIIINDIMKVKVVISYSFFTIEVNYLWIMIIAT